jgi:hypothetical protein
LAGHARIGEEIPPARQGPGGKEIVQKLLWKLNELNPDVDILRVEDKEFLRFGRVCRDCPCEGLLKAMDEGITVGQETPRAEASAPREACPAELGCIAREMFGGSQELRLEWSYGRNTRLTAMEYHKCPEAVVAGSDVLMLLGSVCEISWPAGTFDLSLTKAFLVPRGTVLEISPWCLHGMPIHVREEEGFRCVAILPRGAREPLDPNTRRDGEARLLVGRNTYLIAHSEDEAARGSGAHIGLMGRAIRLATL